MKLSDLKSGQTAVIVKVLGHGAFRKRVMEMGFVKGHKIKAVLSAPLRDPVKYRILGYEVSLRRSEANLIEVEPLDARREPSTGMPASESEPMNPEHTVQPNAAFLAEHTDAVKYPDDHDHEIENPDSPRYRASHTINVALIGNPNCGKTSLFNIASGAQEHVGNYSGVTVDSKTGVVHHKGYTFNFVDLPGTYSLSSYSPEERYVRKYLRDNEPDIILNVVDASNLERNLYLTSELIDMDRPMVIALNMWDELEASGAKLDYRELGRMIGVPMVPTVCRTGRGVERLLDLIISIHEHHCSDVRHVHVALGQDVEAAITPIKDAIKANKSIDQHFAARYIAIKLLEGDKEANEIVGNATDGDKILALRDRKLELLRRQHPHEDVSSLIADEKYGYIAGALAETLTPGEESRNNSSQIIDTIVTSRLFGFPIFLGIMVFVFWMTFYIGAFPADWIQSGVDALSSLVNDHMPEGPLKDLIADGVIGGVGGVIVFLPNILILFFFISFMEDSGYMARAAFIMDKLMHRIGLHGKSFIPLVMGFGCNVPAVMATRTIESRSSKIITVLITPFMSCSARLPIFVLLIGTFFPGHAAWIFLGLYLLGVLVAMGTARLLRRFWFKEDETPFVMELPPYRVPTLKTSMRHMWWKGKQYLQKMGGIILVASVIVWALNYFPRGASEDPDRDSYLETIGKTVNPALEPLGMSWRATVAVVAGIPAKEIVVSTLGVLYTGSEEATDAALSERLTHVAPGQTHPDFTAASAMAFMIFILLYCPCIATVVAIAKETHSWRYGAFAAIYNTLIAWVIAFGVYRLMLLLQ